MTRTHGRCRRGQRPVAAVPASHWQTTAVAAGLRAVGLAAPRVVDRTVAGDQLAADVGQPMAPALRPGDVTTLSRKVPDDDQLPAGVRP